ncbi:MAG TPA: transglycosylase SLT domain-containing protein [Streptomyces sp.]|nr:transglycosylase SLT domain-containing protein [Streptomyces sp.]
MSVPTPERHGRLSRLHKISAVTGAAAVGVTAIAFTVVPGQKGSTSETAGSEMAAKPVALQTAVDSPAAQKMSIDAQTSAADDRARADAKAEARKKAEARAKARHEAAERAEKAQRDRERKQAASRSAKRSASAAAPSGSPKAIARQIIGSETQFQCFSSIVERESGWNVHAQNPSGAYGLVQALPGSKMASAGSDWRNSAATQVKWGVGYMKDRYGSPCGAWSFWQSNNWY